MLTSFLRLNVSTSFLRVNVSTSVCSNIIGFTDVISLTGSGIRALFEALTNGTLLGRVAINRFNTITITEVCVMIQRLQNLGLSDRNLMHPVRFKSYIYYIAH